MCAPHPIHAREGVYYTPPAAFGVAIQNGAVDAVTANPPLDPALHPYALPHPSRPMPEDVDAYLDREERRDLIFGLVLLAAFPAAMFAAYLLV